MIEKESCQYCKDPVDAKKDLYFQKDKTYAHEICLDKAFNEAFITVLFGKERVRE